MRLSAWRDRLFPSPRLDELVFWALDLETSGFTPEGDVIISVGMVPIRGNVIRYGERYQTFVRPRDHEELATGGIRAHHILPGDLSAAPQLAEVLPDIDRRIAEGVLLLHYAALDLAFLKNAYRRHGLVWSAPRVVDTIDLLLKLQQRREQWTPHPAPMQTALPEARAALGLPAYPSHDALSDALSTAELFLVLISKLGAYTLRDIQ